MTIQENTFPAEIWVLVLQRCDQQSLLHLAQVSPFFCREAQKLLLRDVVWRSPGGSGYVPDHTHEQVGIIHGLLYFHKMVKAETVNWRHLIHSADIEVSLWPVPPQISNESSVQYTGNLAFETALLLSRSQELESLCLRLPNSKLAPSLHTISNITSVSVALPHRHSWEDLHTILTLPALTNLTIEYLISPDPLIWRFPKPIPDELHNKASTSNVEHLTLKDCGHLASGIVPLFCWPRDLNTLRYLPSRSRCGPYWRTTLNNTGHISDAVNETIDVLSNLSSSLTELNFELALDRHWIKPFETRELFQHFTKLQKLTTSVELLMYSKGLSKSVSDQPFYDRLPPKLRDLTLKFTSEIPWHSLVVNQESGSQACVLDDPAHLLFDEFVLLAIHKKQFYPELQRLELLGDCGLAPIRRCELAEDSLRALGSELVAVVESGWCAQA